MINGGVLDIPEINVVFAHAILLARNNEKDVKDLYMRGSNPNTTFHKWHYRKKVKFYMLTQGLLYKRIFELRPPSILQSHCFCGFTTMSC